jgi:hypothetical protein
LRPIVVLVVVVVICCGVLCFNLLAAASVQQHLQGWNTFWGKHNCKAALAALTLNLKKKMNAKKMRMRKGKA